MKAKGPMVYNKASKPVDGPTEGVQTVSQAASKAPESAQGGFSFSEAMQALGYLKDVLCSRCGWRKATGSNQIHRICADCHKARPLAAYQEHAGFSTSKLEDYLLKRIEEWVSTLAV